MAARKVALEAKLQQIRKIKDEVKAEIDSEHSASSSDEKFPRATGLSDNCIVQFADGREIKVIIGTSEHIQEPLIQRICRIVDEAYTKVGKHKRVDRYDAVDRLEMGDAGPQANRVLHLAFKGDELVGCASSTFSPGWTPEGCGHWGLLAVDPSHQNSGVATALVIAAERRLATTSAGIQIEYQYTEGDSFSQRLRKWYEEKLGFAGDQYPLRPGQTVFRRCRKRISESEQQKGHLRRLEEIENWLRSEIDNADTVDAVQPDMETEDSSEAEETEVTMQTGEETRGRGGYPVKAA
eukprot:symbB.v1.2.026821.t1/scaffold2709.1/size72633/4